MGRIGFILSSMLALVPLTASAQSGQMQDQAASDACPTPAFGPPMYPPDLAVRGTGGTVLLDLTIDACGRVLQAEVKTSSGHKKLDASALAAARKWVLPPADRARAVAGHVDREVTFNIQAGEKMVPYAKLDWPKSHRRPRYVLDSDFTEFATAAQAKQSVRVPIERTIAPPYSGMMSQFFRYRDQDPVEYWLFLYRAGHANLAARYRLTTEEGEPIVRLGVLCDDKPEACEKASEFLLKGLPFAKAQ